MKLLEWLLRLCPEEFRRAHAEEIQDFAREEHAARCGGALSRIRFWLRLWVNVSLTAFRLRRAQRTRGRSAPVSELAHALVADVCRGVRSIHSTPLVSLVIILTLACGIGLNTAIYSVVHGVLLDPLPYDEPDQLVFLNAGWTSADFSHTSASHTGNSFRTLRREAKSFSDIAAVRDIRQNLTGLDTPAQVLVGWASTNFFRVLGVEPILGPGFAEESPPGTAVLSYQLWQRLFGGDPDIAGRVVRLDDHPYTVAGVLPSDFEAYLPRFPSGIDLWKVPDDWWQNGDVWNAEGAEFALLDLIARLRPGITVAQAQSEMEAFQQLFRSEHIEYEQLGVEYEVLPCSASRSP